MISLYYKFQNKLLVKNILNYIIVIVLMINIVMRIKPDIFIDFTNYANRNNSIILIPQQLFSYCDVYLLGIFIIVMFFMITKDFQTSIEEITLVIGGSRGNKYILRKLLTLFIIYISLYIISYFNIYTIIESRVTRPLMPLSHCLLFSISTNVFIIALSLFILFVTRDIIINTIIMVSYYLIEELFWLCRFTQEKGILAHVYFYNPSNYNQLLNYKIVYVIIAIILILTTYIISSRKRNSILSIFK